MEQDYKRLSDVFMGRGNVRGNEFRLRERVGDACLYEREELESGKCHWEVVLLIKRKATEVTFGGVRVMYEAKEVYPKDEDFGVRGWCYGLEGDARERFAWLVERERVRGVRKDMEDMEDMAEPIFGVGELGDDSE